MMRKIQVIEIIMLFLLVLTNIVSAEGVITSASIENPEDCTYRWSCSDWLPEKCPENRIQTRKCTNAGDCSDDLDKPKEKQGCRYTTIPEHLFDIKLGLQRDVINNVYELSAWVTFESFGSEPTPINLTYIILDEFGNEVYTKEDHVVVETEKFVTEWFAGLDLDYGKYTLVLKTLYNVDVGDEFTQEFTIEREGWLLSLSSTSVMIGALAIIIIFIIGTVIYKDRKSKEVDERK